MDIIDTRDLQDRLEEIEYDLETLDLSADERNDLMVELKAIQEVKAEVEGYASEDWEHGIQLIAEADFIEYCQDLLEDCGEIPPNLPPYIAIDWETTADNLRADYSEVEYEGAIYLFRI